MADFSGKVEYYPVVEIGKKMRKNNLTYRRRRAIIEKEDRETIRHISETLDYMLVVLSKPQNRVKMVMDTAGSGIALFGILSAIEIIKSWIGG
jgi:hypothetical protein